VSYNRQHLATRQQRMHFRREKVCETPISLTSNSPVKTHDAAERAVFSHTRCHWRTESARPDLLAEQGVVRFGATNFPKVTQTGRSRSTWNNNLPYLRNADGVHAVDENCPGMVPMYMEVMGLFSIEDTSSARNNSWQEVTFPSIKVLIYHVVAG
jgi:hypothetical protein